MNGLSFENLPASPESIFQQEYESGQRQIQQQFKLQWNDINRRARSFGSPARHKQALNELYAKGQQAMLQFNQESQQRLEQLKRIDQLAKQGAIRDPDEVKWRIALGPEAERGMFPAQRDPRTDYHANLRLRRELMNSVGAFVLDSKGRLYHSKTDEKGFYLEKIDKSRPANEIERYDWEQSIRALETAKTYGREQIMPKLTGPELASGRLQEMLLDKQEGSWLKKAAKTYLGLTAPGLMYRGYKALRKPTPEAPGTFADKVSATVKQPVARPGVRKPQKITRKQLLAEYKRLGGGQTAEGREFADSYLR